MIIIVKPVVYQDPKTGMYAQATDVIVQRSLADTPKQSRLKGFVPPAEVNTMVERGYFGA